MIITPAIYADNESQVSSDLSPPPRRQPTWLNWFTAILTPQTWLNNLAFNLYYGGSSASMWISGNTYAYGVDVKYLDYSIYECINPAGITSSTPPNQDAANWIKILDTFVGVGERVLYTGQTAMLEYILNYYFSVGTTTLPWIRASHVNQIYIGINTTDLNEFWLTNASLQPLTSYMANAAPFQKQFMRASALYSPFAFTIYVPSATATAITANQVSGVTYVNVITAIVQKYAQANFLYNITTY